jgi:hypothetical protein
MQQSDCNLSGSCIKREVYNAALEGVEWIISIFSSKNLSLSLFQAGLSMKDNIEESQY